MSDTPYCTCGTALNDDDYCEVHTPLAERDATIQQQAAQVAVLREALELTLDCDSIDRLVTVAAPALRAALAAPNPAAERLVAERDAGRALYDAVRGTAIDFEDEDVSQAFEEALEAYRKVLEAV